MNFKREKCEVDSITIFLLQFCVFSSWLIHSSRAVCTSAQIDERARARFGANAFLARLTTVGDPALGSRLPAGGRTVGQPAWAEPNPDWPSWRQSKSRNLSRCQPSTWLVPPWTHFTDVGRTTRCYMFRPFFGWCQSPKKAPMVPSDQHLVTFGTCSSFKCPGMRSTSIPA